MTFRQIKYDIQDVQKKLDNAIEKLEYRIYPCIAISEAIEMLVDIRKQIREKK